MTGTFLRRQIFLPQDHGSWVFIFSPLLIGLFAAGTFSFASLILVVAALTVFLIRQPITVAVKVYSGRRAKDDLSAAAFWLAVYSFLLLLAMAGLWRLGLGSLLALAVPAVPVFAWHLWLVSRREERRQVNVELAATGVLSLAAPAAYWTGVGRYDPIGWWLWILVWLQTAASIVYTYLRLEQRQLSRLPARRERWQMGSRSFLYTAFNLVLTLVLGALGFLPRLLFLPYLVQWSETLWGIFNPAVKWKPTRIGIRQLAVSTIWTILFIITWRL